MKAVLKIFIFCIATVTVAQIKPGFYANEASYTIAMCNSFNFTKQFGSTENIIPENFNLLYASEILSMDNKFEIYENGNTGVINYRGSTDKIISWVENFYSAMIPAQGEIIIDDETHHYNFSAAKNAAVHAGYALSIVLLSEKITEQVKALNANGIYDIVITGHSQGGALATMTRAYLENLPPNKLSAKNNFKTYAYAQPMSGNKEFAKDYNNRFSKLETSYSIINPKDPIPYMPFNYEEEKLISKEKVKGWLFGKKKFKAKKLGQDAFIRLFERGLTKYIKSSNKLINKILGLKFGKIVMPEFVADINYYPTGTLQKIAKFKYPRVEVDVTGLSEKERKGLEQRSNGKWYKKETKFFQHKPYNYYVQVLKKWNRNAYRNLNETYLESDL
ncbi:MAG: lipase family protein [Oceanihabitans sp.]